MRIAGGVAAALIAAAVWAGQAQAANVLPNGSFEGTTSGWDSSSATLALAGDGVVGAQALRVARSGNVSTYSVTSVPRPVTATVAGTTYTVSAWIRSATPGKSVCLRLREWKGSTQAGTATTCLTAAGGWQQLPSFSYAVKGGGDSIDLLAYQGGAAAGDSFELDGVVLDDGKGAVDTTPPETTITAAPSGSTTDTSAQVSFTASENGSSFRCSLDGGAFAACTSPASYSSLAAGSHTFQVAATDAAGNTDPTPAAATWTVETAPQPSADPTLLLVGDQHACDGPGLDQVASLLGSLDPADAIVSLGDASGDTGTLDEYDTCFDPAWGKYKARVHPVLGNHDWRTGTANGYFTYWGAAAGPVGRGWYSFDAGAWHVIVLSSYCGKVGGCSATTPQGQWLQQDLAAHASQCTLAVFHHPYYTSFLQPDYSGGQSAMQGFWKPLYQAGADVIVNAHSHVYERFAPQDPFGAADPQKGIREFIVGTGGGDLHTNYARVANEEAWSDSTWGVLELTLHASSYDWKFVPVAGSSFTDSGTGSCH